MSLSAARILTMTRYIDASDLKRGDVLASGIVVHEIRVEDETVCVTGAYPGKPLARHEWNLNLRLTLVER